MLGRDVGGTVGFPGRADEEYRDRGANQQGRPWDRGRFRGGSVEPWEEYRGTGEWSNLGNRAGAGGLENTGRRLRENTREKNK